MKLHILVTVNARHQVTCAEALVRALQKTGDNAEIFTEESEARRYGADALCTWGWRKGHKLKQAGWDVLVMERAYLADRFHYTSLGWNGLNGRAVWPMPDIRRWQAKFSPLLKAWRTPGSGSYALVMAQVPTDMACKKISMNAWLGTQTTKLRMMGYEHVYVRNHPQCPDWPSTAWETLSGTLEDALLGAAVVVTYNSNAGVDSVLAGVPTVTMDQGAMAWPVTSHSVGEDVVRPDRTAWCAAMASRQWTTDEIQTGEAWPAVKRALAASQARRKMYG